MCIKIHVWLISHLLLSPKFTCSLLCHQPLQLSPATVSWSTLPRDCLLWLSLQGLHLVDLHKRHNGRAPPYFYISIFLYLFLYIIQSPYVFSLKVEEDREASFWRSPLYLSSPAYMNLGRQHTNISTDYSLLQPWFVEAFRETPLPQHRPSSFCQQRLSFVFFLYSIPSTLLHRRSLRHPKTLLSASFTFY